MTEWQVALVILFSSTAIFSLVSNVLAIFILLNQDCFTSELWKYLVNLSVADILMALFCIPVRLSPTKKQWLKSMAVSLIIFFIFIVQLRFIHAWPLDFSNLDVPCSAICSVSFRTRLRLYIGLDCIRQVRILHLASAK